MIRYAREGRAPTMEYADQLTHMIEEELRMVESDEIVQHNRQEPGMSTDGIRVHACRANETNPKEKGAGPPIYNSFAHVK